MRFLECAGSPREIGRQQGETLREEIAARWEEDIESHFGAMLKNTSDCELIARVHAVTQSYIQGQAPELLEEIAGIGEGANISPERALFLSTYNSLTVMSSVLGDNHLGHLAGGCTALAFARSPAGPFLMKTNDACGGAPVSSEAQRREAVERENRWLYVLKSSMKSHTVLGVRWAGSIWTDCGLNARGVAMGSASLHPRLNPQSAAALPQHWLGTLALYRSTDTREAQKELHSVPVFGKGYAMAIGDISGDAVGIEKTGAHTGINAVKDGLAFQTNHVRSSELAEQGREQTPEFWDGKYYRNSSRRAQSIERHSPHWKAMTDFDALAADLFHAGAQGDLIQNGDASCEHWLTTWGALIFPRHGEMWVTEGLPEECRFQKWKLNYSLNG